MILVAGSANLDFVVRAGHIPAPGETVLGRDFQTFPGGKGANQAVACAHMSQVAGGVQTRFLGAFGNDDFAKPLLASLAAAGVKVAAVSSAQPTGTAFICVSDAGENAITVAPGANADLQPAHWPHDLPISHLLMQLETPVPTVLAFARAARKQGAKVVLNAAPAPADGLPAELLGALDILIVNEGELITLDGKGECEPLLRSLAAQHNIPTIIVTLGAKGCFAWHEGNMLRQAAFSVPVTDTTAAGDTFCGSLVAALAHGYAMQQALRQACAASALACTVLGAQSSIPRHADVQEFLRKRNYSGMTPSPSGRGQG